jgi:hypothetical protein
MEQASDDGRRIEVIAADGIGYGSVLRPGFQWLLLLLGLMIGLSLPAGAKPVRPAPELKVRIEPPDEVEVGQPAVLTLGVRLPKAMAASIEWPRLQVQDAVTMADGEFAARAERIRGADYQGWQRRYLIHPLKAGRLEVGPERVLVHPVAKPGASGPAIALPLPPLSFQARLPAGAEDHGYFLPARRATLAQSFDRSLEGLEAGSTLKRTVTLAVEGVPARLLPALSVAAVDGASAALLPPVLADRSDETMESRRVETVAYVFDRAGDFRLPPVRVYWWDLNARCMREAVVAEQAVHVDPGPAERRETSRRQLIAGALALFGLVVLSETILFARRSKV